MPTTAGVSEKNYDLKKKTFPIKTLPTQNASKTSNAMAVFEGVRVVYYTTYIVVVVGC